MIPINEHLLNKQSHDLRLHMHVAIASSDLSLCVAFVHAVGLFVEKLRDLWNSKILSPL